MKVVVESLGVDAADDFFKHVGRIIIHDLKLKESPSEGATKTVELVFKCRAPEKDVPQDVNLVTVYHTPPKNREEELFLQAVEKSVTGMGKGCWFCSYNVLPKG